MCYLLLHVRAPFSHSLLFFHCSRALWDLHSFPTRRSSDLDRFGEVSALFRWVRQHIRYTRDIYRVELLHTARRMLELRADRKTTRLNSSHRTISYAVFCLKKKNTLQYHSIIIC